MMKSVMAVENRKERRNKFSLRLFTFVMGLYFCTLLLTGCATRQPGETAAEVSRRHQRVNRMNLEMMMADIDKFLLLDRPSMASEKTLP